MPNAADEIRISWTMISPGAPYFGGLRESGVKLANSHLRRVKGNNVLTYEVLSTLLCDNKAILKPRPLLQFFQYFGPAEAITRYEGDSKRDGVPAKTSAPTDDKYTSTLWNTSSQTVGTHAETHWNFMEARMQGVFVISVASDEVDFKATNFWNGGCCAPDERKPNFLQGPLARLWTLHWKNQPMPISEVKPQELLCPTLHQTKEAPSQCWLNLVHSMWAAMLLARGSQWIWN